VWAALGLFRKQPADCCRLHARLPARKERALGRQGRAGQAAAWQAAPAIAGTRRRFEQQELGTWGSLVEGTVEGAIVRQGVIIRLLEPGPRTKESLKAPPTRGGSIPYTAARGRLRGAVHA